MARELLPTFYARQDVRSDDLNQLFSYDDDLFRAHNRAFHGCGVVCGLVVTLRTGHLAADVAPGYAVGPQGHEIFVPETVCVPLDCVELVEVDCADLTTGGRQSGGFKPVYIALRHVAELGRERLLAPARCAPRECAPTRRCDSFEIVCTTRQPAPCQPRPGLAGCAAHPRMLRALATAGDLAETGLLGCEPDSAEEWLTLARVEFERDGEGRISPSLSFAERLYLPSTQFILDLARRVASQALKSQARRKAITGLGDNAVARLRLNRGVEIGALAIHGRELSSARSVVASDPAIATSLVPRADPDAPLRISVTVPFITSSDEVGLTVTLRSGLSVDSTAQPAPVVIELTDTPVDGIPLLHTEHPLLRQAIVERLRASGYTTAQAIAVESSSQLALNALLVPGLGVNLSLDFAARLVKSAQRWLRSGAPKV